MPLTSQQFDIYKARLRAALADADTPAEVKDKLRDLARRFPELEIKSQEDLFNEVRDFAQADPATWTAEQLVTYTKWVLENRPA